MVFRDILQSTNGLVEWFTGSFAFVAPLATRVVVGLDGGDAAAHSSRADTPCLQGTQEGRIHLLA